MGAQGCALSPTPPREKRSQDGQQLGRKSEDPWKGPLEGAAAIHLQCPRSRDDDFDGEVYQCTAHRQGSTQTRTTHTNDGNSNVSGEQEGTHTLKM